MSLYRVPVSYSLIAALLFSITFSANVNLLHAQPKTQQQPRAQQPKTQQQTGNTPRLPRPAAQAMPVKLRPELKFILENWEKAGDFTKTMEGQHYRYIFDDVFAVQKISQGEFFYKAHDQGRIDLNVPKNLKEGEKIERNGKTYTIKKDNGERWICDGTQVFAIDEERKEFQRLPIPEQSRGKNIVDGPLPFLFGISKEKVTMRYHVTLFTKEKGGQHDYRGGIIHLKVKPLWKQDAANWQEAEVMLNSKDYLPTAIRLIHPGGNSETVYVFSNVKRNPKKRLVGLIWGSNPFAPSLRGYKELTSAAVAPKQGTPTKKR